MKIYASIRHEVAVESVRNNKGERKCPRIMITWGKCVTREKQKPTLLCVSVERRLDVPAPLCCFTVLPSWVVLVCSATSPPNRKRNKPVSLTLSRDGNRSKFSCEAGFSTAADK